MALPKHHEANLKTIYKAADARRLAVVECRRRADGKVVALLVAVGDDGKEYGFTPFAEMMDCNPFEAYDPPNPDGGFEPVAELND